MAWIPHITAASVVERDGAFLLVRELVAGRAVYNQPAGHLEENESLADAAVRETLEETALQFVPEHLLGVYHWQQARCRETYIRVAFTGRVEGEPRPEVSREKGILGTRWLSREKLLALPPSSLRSPMVLKCIEDYLAGVRYPLSALPYINDRA